MNDCLYSRSEAVASLNRVEGFDPLKLARRITKEGPAGTEEQLYLDVKFRKLWFRLVHPVGKIAKRIVSFADNMAVVEARVYLNKDDPEENYIANAYSQKFRSDDPLFGEKFLETAETAAIGRALADAGFGLQFAESEEDDPAQVDAGIPVPGNGLPMQGAAQPAITGQPVQPQGNTFPQAQWGMGQPAPPPAFLDASLPVEELVQRMSYEQASGFVIPVGKYKGRTMGQAAVENPGILQWYAEKYQGSNHLVPAAARVILNRALPMAG